MIKQSIASAETSFDHQILAAKRRHFEGRRDALSPNAKKMWPFDLGKCKILLSTELLHDLLKKIADNSSQRRRDSAERLERSLNNVLRTTGEERSVQAFLDTADDRESVCCDRNLPDDRHARPKKKKANIRVTCCTRENIATVICASRWSPSTTSQGNVPQYTNLHWALRQGQKSLREGQNTDLRRTQVLFELQR